MKDNLKYDAKLYVLTIERIYDKTKLIKLWQLWDLNPRLSTDWCLNPVSWHAADATRFCKSEIVVYYPRIKT